MTFDGSAIDGFSRVQEADVLARPDPTTFQLLPWHGPDETVARVFCDIFTLEGAAFEGCPRHALHRTLERATRAGYTFFAAPELEYFYFADDDPRHPPRTLDSGSYFDLSVTDLSSDLRRKTVLMLEEMGIPVEHAQHEDAPSQHEIDLRYTDALTMADTVMTTRLVVKEVARRQGVFASFMPKPLAGMQGSGMHTHLSLWNGEHNAFVDEDDPYGLSAVAYRFIAGLLHHAPEITAVTNQWVNSYKRLVSGYEAPIHVSWARNNRSALVRVPVVKSGKVESTRVEYRAPDSACNPYLAFAVVLAAGLRGVEHGYELPPEADDDLFSLAGHELAAKGLAPLPSSLNEAVDVMERSELVAETLGDHVFEWFIRNKRDEWAAYRSEVTQFEIARYLPTL
jgi:glutamine synthetase